MRFPGIIACRLQVLYAPQYHSLRLSEAHHQFARGDRDLRETGNAPRREKKRPEKTLVVTDAQPPQCRRRVFPLAQCFVARWGITPVAPPPSPRLETNITLRQRTLTRVQDASRAGNHRTNLVPQHGPTYSYVPARIDYTC